MARTRQASHFGIAQEEQEVETIMGVKQHGVPLLAVSRKSRAVPVDVGEQGCWWTSDMQMIKGLKMLEAQVPQALMIEKEGTLGLGQVEVGIVEQTNIRCTMHICA